MSNVDGKVSGSFTKRFVEAHRLYTQFPFSPTAQRRFFALANKKKGRKLLQQVTDSYVPSKLSFGEIGDKVKGWFSPAPVVGVIKEPEVTANN
jgi:hypothetical protein